MSEFSIERANRFINEQANTIDVTYAPEVHFSAPIGWINDPNGFVYFKGEYHLFYQYYPYDAIWGPMHWGHAKSKDLIHWEHLPVALAPDQSYDRDGCFSGSAIVKDDMLWLMYTGNIHGENGTGRQIQNMAYSKDGIHFEKVSQNPVLTDKDLPDGINPCDFRDPKLFEKDGKYYSVIAARHTDQVGCILLYSSDNLVDWKYESIFLKGTPEHGEMWECPDYFNLDGQDTILLSPMRFPKAGLSHHNINTTVAIRGTVDWDKKQFIAESFDELDHGHDFYAPQSLEDDQGRRIMIAWQNTWGRRNVTKELGHRWAYSMSMPRQLNWHENHMKQTPVTELFTESVEKVEHFKNANMLKIYPNTNENFKIKIGTVEDYYEVYYQKDTHSVHIDRTGLKIELKGEENEPVIERGVKVVEDQLSQITMILDRNSMELFVNEGIGTLTSNIYFEDVDKTEIDIVNGEVTIEYYKIG